VEFLPEGWSDVLLSEAPVVEIIVRGTLTYLGLFTLLRLVLKRQAGTLGVTDLLLVVLIADAARTRWPTITGLSPTDFFSCPS
jgi:hypothetical protein